MNHAVEAISTRVAHWGWDDHRFLGHAAFGELAGRESVTSLAALAATRRRVGPEARDVLDDIAACVTLADTRIWPLKLTRLIASYGAVIPATAAGLVTLERAQIGSWPCAQAARVLATMCRELGDASTDPVAVRGWAEAYFTTHGFMWGYGTPFRGRDERLTALRACMVRRGNRHELPHWRAMEVLAAAVRELRGAEPNVCSGIGASCLDVGIAPDEVSVLSMVGLLHTFLANAVEGAAQQSPQLRRLPDACANYVGRAARTSPRALSTAASRT